MAEIINVRDMENAHDQADESSMSFHNSLIIETDSAGFNSGRTYYLQASCKEECHSIIQKLTACAQAARDKAQQITLLSQAQLRLRKLYNSPAFQHFFALLILAVNIPFPWQLPSLLASSTQ